MAPLGNFRCTSAIAPILHPTFTRGGRKSAWRKLAANPGLSRISVCLRRPGLPKSGSKSGKSPALTAEYSQFAETIGGDGLDRDCRPRAAVAACRRDHPPGHPETDLLGRKDEGLSVFGRLTPLQPLNSHARVVAMDSPSCLYQKGNSNEGSWGRTSRECFRTR